MRLKKNLIMVVFCIMFCFLFGEVKTYAAAVDSKPIIEEIDYEECVMSIDLNGNNEIFYSDKNKKTWAPIEQANIVGGKVQFDISWISPTRDYELNLRGDKDEEQITTITLPAQNTKLRVTFDKADGNFSFTNLPTGVATFEWKKTKDTLYQTPILNTEQNGAQEIVFLEMVESFRVKGISLTIRTPQIKGKKESDGTISVGMRPSKEVKVSVAKKGNAPSVKINGSKLNLNTKTTMEYYNTKAGSGVDPWTDMGKDMTISSIPMLADALATDVAAGGTSTAGRNNVSIQIRMKKIENKTPTSKILTLVIPKQAAAPTCGTTGTNVTYSYDTTKTTKQLVLTFHNASTTVPYEYAIIKQGDTFTPETAKWKSVTKATPVKVSERTAPANSKIYVRLKMIKESKTTQFQLASATTNFTVSYPS